MTNVLQTGGTILIVSLRSTEVAASLHSCPLSPPVASVLLHVHALVATTLTTLNITLPPEVALMTNKQQELLLGVVECC